MERADTDDRPGGDEGVEEHEPEPEARDEEPVRPMGELLPGPPVGGAGDADDDDLRDVDDDWPPTTGRPGPRVGLGVLAATAVVALFVGLAIGVLVAGGDDDDPVETAAPTTTAAPTGDTTGATTATTVAPPPESTAATVPTVDAPAGSPCDPAGPPASDASLRCVPLRWGEPARGHVWWPVDEPVEGEYEVRGECRRGVGSMTAFGTIVNRSDRPRSVAVDISFLDGGAAPLASGSSTPVDLAPGASAEWRVTVDVDALAVDECHIDGAHYV